jgi:hypothetical protein
MCMIYLRTIAVTTKGTSSTTRPAECGEAGANLELSNLKGILEVGHQQKELVTIAGKWCTEFGARNNGFSQYKLI